jgi:hypothetical protein
MVADLMAGGPDSRYQLSVAQCPFPNEKERSLGVMTFENIENFGSKGRVWPIIERERDQGEVGSYSIDYVWSDPLEQTKGNQGLYPEHQKPRYDDDGTTYQEKHLGFFPYSMGSFR